MTLKSIRFTDEDIQIIESVMAKENVSFSSAIKILIRKNHKGEISDLDKSQPKERVSKRGYYVRFHAKDEKALVKMAEANAISVPHQIRHLVMACNGNSVFFPLEARMLRVAANDISKTGRMLNRAIQEKRILGSAVAMESKEQINVLAKVFNEMYHMAMKRVK